MGLNRVHSFESHDSSPARWQGCGDGEAQTQRPDTGLAVLASDSDYSADVAVPHRALLLMLLWISAAGTVTGLMLGFFGGLQMGLNRGRFTKDWLELGWRRHWYVEIRCPETTGSEDGDVVVEPAVAGRVETHEIGPEQPLVDPKYPIA